MAGDEKARGSIPGIRLRDEIQAGPAPGRHGQILHGSSGSVLQAQETDPEQGNDPASIRGGRPLDLSKGPSPRLHIRSRIADRSHNATSSHVSAGYTTSVSLSAGNPFSNEKLTP